MSERSKRWRSRVWSKHTALDAWADGAERNVLLWSLGAFIDVASNNPDADFVVETIEKLTDMEEEHNRLYAEEKWPELLELAKFFGQAAETLQILLKTRDEVAQAELKEGLENLKKRGDSGVE